MKHHSETLTGGIHHILFGKHKPDRILERYEQQQADSDLYHHLDTFPDTPESYTVLHESIRARWKPRITGYEETFREWLPSFYALPEKQSGAFHILCDFYSSFIRAECRMIIQVSEAWKEDLAISTLTFETVTLRNELLELIRETSKRLKMHHSTTLKGNLNRFVLVLLQNNLLITLFELQKRSSHLFEQRLIHKRELFLKYLKQPEPKDSPWHRTATLTRFELEGALRTPEKAGQLRSAEDLLANVRSEYPDHTSKIQDSINLLENAWFCLFIMNESDIWNTLDVTHPEKCAEMISDVHHQLYQVSAHGDRADTKEIIQTIIQRFDQIQSVLSSGSAEITSSAGILISSVKSHYEDHSEDDSSVNQTGSNGSAIVREVPRSAILDQFIPVDDIQEKLNVSQKSMNNYLSKSRTPVHNFSNKTRLMHINDFNAMMDHFKTTL